MGSGSGSRDSHKEIFSELRKIERGPDEQLMAYARLRAHVYGVREVARKSWWRRLFRL